MRVLHVSYSDSVGGAGKAAYRLHNALRRQGVDSHMLVTRRRTEDPDVEDLSRIGKFAHQARRLTVRQIPFRQKYGLSPAESPAILPSFLPRWINQSKYDIVHLHWVGGEMLSVKDLSKIELPVVWTLHDMWAFCGAENYSSDSRWLEGYTSESREPNEKGFDLNRWTWLRKKRLWTRPIQIVTPSRWLASCVGASPLLKNMDVRVIPNAIDTRNWTPKDRFRARKELGIPLNVPLVLFGAVNATSDTRKGLDLLALALHRLAPIYPNLHLAVFGHGEGHGLLPPSTKVKFLGHVSDDRHLQTIYSAADAFVLPSRLDNLPNTGLEALSCGTPVVGFKIGGLTDIVEHKHNGYLAEPFDADDLADGISWVLNRSSVEDLSASDGEEPSRLRRAARNKAEQTFAEQRVCESYFEVYTKVVDAGQTRIQKIVEKN